MPGKFPRVFQKRKSSGDVLEDRPVSSFRVLERPAEYTNSLDEKPPLGLRRTTDFRPASEGTLDALSARPGSQPLNRGSGGTNKSSSSYGVYDSSSGRYSSTSTLPSASSVETVEEHAHPHGHPKSSKTMPAEHPHNEQPGFLRTAGRKFSFGGKKSMQAADVLRSQEAPTILPERPLYAGVHDLNMSDDLPAIPPIGRHRATTETSYASESTITPGRTATLEKLDFKADEDEGGFGDIFAGIGEDRRRSRMLAESTAGSLGRPSTDVNTYMPYRPESAMPAPLKPTRPLDASPALDSATSADGLMVASPTQEDSLFEIGLTSPEISRPSQAHGTPSPIRPPASRPRRQSRASMKGFLPRRDSSYHEDTDALLVSESATRKSTIPTVERIPTTQSQSNGGATTHQRSASPQEASGNPWAEHEQAHAPTPPAHRQTPELRFSEHLSPEDIDENLLNDESFQSLAISAHHVEARVPSPPRVKPAGKIMTPAQFERYRKEKAKEKAQRMTMDEDSDSGSSKSEAEEEEDEEDERERNKRMAKQRQRQEAQLSVYRQSMMKITGEQPLGPSSSSLRPPGSRLTGKISNSSLRQSALAQQDEEDEDDDVPLGILAAHGFPSKEHDRAPNHEQRAPGIQYSSEAYPPPLQLGVGGSSNNLPAFARKLPQDPFYGASLVNQTDRQSFALGGGSPGSVYGGSQAGSQVSTHLPPPGGLIGVIASEERARAIRRGSPAKTFGFGAQDPGGSMPLPPGVGGQPIMPQPTMPPPQPTVNAEQQANVQMAQQMTQMMQMQMRWMQQMMAMQSQGLQMPPQMQAMQQQMMMGGGGMNMGMMQGGMPGMQMPGPQPGARASTMLGPPNMHPNLAGNQGGRAMSMMHSGREPSVMLNQAPTPGYTPSIAPSERSNIGQPSRYRPVNVVSTADARSRTQSMSSKSNLGAFSNNANGARTSTMLGGGAAAGIDSRPRTSSGLRDRGKNVVNVRLVETRGADDDEDEAGWEELRRKKESKRSMWRLRKGGQGGGNGKENVSPNRGANQQQDTGLQGMFVPDVGSI